MFRYAIHILFVALSSVLCNMSIAQVHDQTQLLIGRGWGNDQFMFYAPAAMDRCSDDRKLVADAIDIKIKRHFPQLQKNAAPSLWPNLADGTSRYFKAVELDIEAPLALKKLADNNWSISTKAGLQASKLEVYVVYPDGGGSLPCWLLGTPNWQAFQQQPGQNFLSVALQTPNGNATLFPAKTMAQGFRDIPDQGVKLMPSVMKQIESIPRLKTRLKKELNFATEIIETPHLPVQVTEEEWIKKGYQAYVDKRKSMPPPAPPKSVVYGEDNWRLGGMQKFRAAIAKENRDFLMFYLFVHNAASHKAGVNAVVDLSQKRICRFRAEMSEDDVEVMSILGVLDSNRNGTDEWLVSYSYYEGISYAIVEPEVKDGKCELKTLAKTAYFGL